MILIDCIYTNHSGSQRLLEYFIDYSIKKGLLDKYFFLFDARLKSRVTSLVAKERSLVLSPGEGERKEYYKKLPSGITTIYIFGSVPPPVAVKEARVIIMQHNPFFFRNPGYSLKGKFIYFIKATYIKFKTLRRYEWVVQNQKMKELLVEVLPVDAPKIFVIPFFELSPFIKPAATSDRGFTFFYPADGVPSKNHLFLFDVWEQLYFEDKLSPELHVTVPDKFPALLKRIEELKAKGVNITNHGFVSQAAVAELYGKCTYMVFPSLNESFGLPLVEAAVSGLKVVGSNLPYIYEIIEPSATFDPYNKSSLREIILSIRNNSTLPDTRIVIEDRIDDLMNFIHKN